MTENVANVDVEDVLSSIRRLVSDEVTPRKVAPADDPGEDVGEKLVLTPALRVIPEEQISTQPAEPDTPLSREMPADGSDALEDTIAALEAAVNGEDADWEPDGSENEPVLDPPPVMFRKGKPDEGRDVEVSNVPVFEGTPPEFDRFSTPGRRLNLSPPANEPAPLNDANASAEVTLPDGDEASIKPDPLVLEPESSVQTVEVDEGLAGFASFEDEPQTQADEAPDLVEADPQPPVPEEIVPGPTGEDIAEDPAPTIEAAAVVEATAHLSRQQADDAEEVLLDEETLSAMIASIVRDELRGTFGDEITRNIRKLIRREIHAYFDVGEEK